MNRILFVAALGLAAGFTALALPAQSIDGREVRFGIMGGATQPVGDVGYVANLDWNLGALVSFGASSSRFSFRVDGQWQRLAGTRPLTGSELSCGAQCLNESQPSAQDFRVLDLTTNAVFNLTPMSPRNFYLIAGVGAYNARQSDPAGGRTESLTRFGFNAGAGFKFRAGRVSPFLEARYHDIVGGHSFQGGQFQASNTFQFVPINIGFLF
jgi:opacity protein-like surface antigen